ncbi:hypothetical protein OG883_18220 [Streptomyces sp. NBC_01142]|uniref:hypothetical protein n=1 Tax=Streptomyces sp. NBC_01142 TaxID=2975865 RepID=UPI0022501B92|nr:hypothetical protein [Streptomyces sp. NBC_01142]MCX4821788.1 hypothetical protein [Streptomyces sp. NBC_01142]
MGWDTHFPDEYVPGVTSAAELLVTAPALRRDPAAGVRKPPVRRPPLACRPVLVAGRAVMMREGRRGFTAYLGGV